MITMIAVTGASGKLGRLVIKELLERGTGPEKIIAMMRKESDVASFASSGVRARVADYEVPSTLERALEGVEKLLLISSSEVGKRVSQHANVVSAAQSAGVQFLAYTSLLKADVSKMQLAVEHVATEKIIRDSGLAYVLLRHGWYIENHTEHLDSALNAGVILGSTQDGRISAATRADYAAAAVTILLGPANRRPTYELGGKAYSLSELARVVTKAIGKEVQYVDVPPADHVEKLLSFGVPLGMAQFLADCDAGAARGDLFTESRELDELLPRSLTPLEVAVSHAVQM